eukprot:TRINITY_DN6997_c0_g1_i3.p1 TRINITY_DN6997_c0_g1~~TRINITY_DN6997_c0_g1_i3.p1  ORF type:complete len:220 (+),score=44.55 TRINITY_DN6997_c0_g1_i3:76-735(+)
MSFELYNLGPNSELIINNLTLVGPTLKEMGLETLPMVSSYPYPPQFLSWMRELFKNPRPFMDKAIAELQRTGYSGYNLDFEPTDDATSQDASDYAKFLTTFANELHRHGKKLTVDVASWNPLWNWTLISESNVDKVYLMSTYTANDASFKKELFFATRDISISKLGVGLESDTKPPLTEAQLEMRFKLLEELDIQEIDIWRTPIPDSWWPHLLKFRNLP